MLLGKRPRPPMKRTTSMSEITLDLNTPAPAPGDAAPDPNHQEPSWWKQPQAAPDQSRVLATVSPRNHRRQCSSADVEHFLRSCSLCKRPLVPGRDIYMYRGDSGFCSQECRQEQMKEDEKKDKFCVASKKQVQPLPPPPSASQVAT